jgi:hypothetical protein
MGFIKKKVNISEAGVVKVCKKTVVYNISAVVLGILFLHCNLHAQFNSNYIRNMNLFLHKFNFHCEE